MASIARAAKALFTKRPLLTNCVIYGSLYVGAEFSQQTLTRKILVRNIYFFLLKKLLIVVVVNIYLV